MSEGATFSASTALARVSHPRTFGLRAICSASFRPPPERVGGVGAAFGGLVAHGLQALDLGGVEGGRGWSPSLLRRGMVDASATRPIGQHPAMVLAETIAVLEEPAVRALQFERPFIGQVDVALPLGIESERHRHLKRELGIADRFEDLDRLFTGALARLHALLTADTEHDRDAAL